MSMPTKTITLKVPSNISKKKIEEAIKRLELEEKYKKTDNFKLFVKDEDFKMKIYKIAEFVEKYLKKKYPKEEFEIILDYDGIDEKVIVEVVFKKKLDKRKLKDIKLVIRNIKEVIFDAWKEVHKKFPDMDGVLIITSDLEVL